MKAHETSFAVWDIPLPVVITRSFRIKVGAKCSAACQLAAEEIQVYDETGTKMASARLAETPWVGADSLYWTEVQLLAPSDVREHWWTVKLMTSELTLLHAEASSKFSFRTANPSEHRVRIRVVEKNTECPVENVQVRLDVYEAVTDKDGVATLQAPKGTYDLRIWKVGYETLPKTVDVTAEVNIHVEVAAIPEPEEPYWL